MYRTYHLTDEEKGKIIRRRYDGDTAYFDVFESQEECDREEERLAGIDKEYERAMEEYRKSLEERE